MEQRYRSESKTCQKKKKLNKLSDKDGVSDDARTHRHTGNQGNRKQMGNKKAETNHDK